MIFFILSTNIIYAQNNNWDTPIQLGQLVIAAIALGVTIIGTILVGWVTLRIQVTKLETSTRLKFLEIEKDISSNNIRITKHTDNLNSININLPQMKSDILGEIGQLKINELSPIKISLEVIKSHLLIKHE